MTCLLSHFCYCCSLKTGTKVIGTFSMMFGILGFSQSLIIIITMLNKADAATEPTYSLEMKKTATSQVTWMIISTIMIGATISLLVAAFKNRIAMLLLPWLILEPFFTSIGVASNLYKGVLSITATNQIDVESASSIASALIVTVIEFYVCLVVYNYYRQLKRIPENNEEIIIKTHDIICEPTGAHENEAYSSPATSTKSLVYDQGSQWLNHVFTSNCKRKNDNLSFVPPAPKQYNNDSLELLLV